jgi:hypothetical protein
MNAWTALRRPLLLSFFLACTISFLTARTLTLRLIVPAIVYWSFVPMVQIGALAAVCRRDRQAIRFGELIDIFFKGNAHWFLWLTGLCAIWSLFSPETRSVDWAVSVIWFLGGLVLSAAWSLHIDFRFFRSVLQRSPGTAMRHLVVHRVISWSLILTIVGAPTIWSDVAGRLW